MDFLLTLSRGIDRLNGEVGQAARWLVLLASLVSDGNALMRYGFGLGSNAWLELQWYLFALVFLLGAGYTHLHNGHVRIDVIFGRFTPRTRAWIDLLGGLLFLLPLAGLVAWLGWFAFVNAWSIGECSPDAGGLLRWPIKLAIPLGFGLLFLQGISECIKRWAFLAGRYVLREEQSEEVV